MMKAGTETGNLENHMMSRVTPIKPEIGMGATMLAWTDRYAGTIVKITPCQIHVQEDNATRTDSNGMSESQDYHYEANPLGKIYIFRKTKKGYRSNGLGLLIGTRDKYYDYSF